MDDNVTISKERYEELLDAELKLSCLESGGVDNWDFYDDAMEAYHAAKINQED